MGFAALETIGYGFAAAQASSGIGAVETTLIVRGLLSPAGHGAWTGLVCAVLWREREKLGRRVLDLPLAAAFTAAVIFPRFLGYLQHPDRADGDRGVGIEVGSGSIALVSLALLFHMVNEAAHRRAQFVPGCST